MGYSGFSVVKGGLYTMGAFGKEEQPRLQRFDRKESLVFGGRRVADQRMGRRPPHDPYGGRRQGLCPGDRAIWSVLMPEPKENLERRLVSDLGGKVPTWGYTESVLVDEGRVILYTWWFAEHSPHWMQTVENFSGKAPNSRTIPNTLLQS